MASSEQGPHRKGQAALPPGPSSLAPVRVTARKFKVWGKDSRDHTPCGKQQGPGGEGTSTGDTQGLDNGAVYQERGTDPGMGQAGEQSTMK